MFNILQMQAQFAEVWLRMAETSARAMSDACLKASQDATKAMVDATSTATRRPAEMPFVNAWPMPVVGVSSPFAFPMMSSPFGWPSAWSTPQPWAMGFGLGNAWSPFGISGFDPFSQPKSLASQLVDMAFASYRSAGGHAVAALGRPMVPLPHVAMPWCAGPGAIAWRSLLN